jgi:integrase
MATYRKLPSGRWEFAVSVGGRRKSKTHDTKAKGRAWAAEMELQLGRGEGISGDHTLSELFREYADKVSGGKKGSRWEIIRLKRFEGYPLACKRLVEVRREDIEQWIDSRLREGVKASSVNRELNLISHCLTQARRWRWMEHNPTQDLQRPRNPPHRERLIEEGETELVLAAAGYSEDLPVVTQRQKTAVAFLLAIETAMRAGEICSLTPESINHSERTAFLADTKNGHPRKVPLSSEALRLLGRLPPVEPGQLLFGMASGTLSTHFKKITSDAGIKGLTFHDTRHEAITRLAKKLNILDLARAVGHKNIKQLGTYYNLSAADIAKQLD